MRAVQYLKHVRTGRGNKKSLQPIRSKENSLLHGSRAEHRYMFLRVMFRFSIAFFAFPLVIASILQQSLQNRWPQLKDCLCEKVELSVTYQICSFLFSAHFVATMSKALQIPKWRIFNIWTEEGDQEGCLIVKFGIIGTGNPPFPANCTVGCPFCDHLWNIKLASMWQVAVLIVWQCSTIREPSLVHSSYKVSRSS